MSDIIRVLPDSVANQIAAGEVIQRPASVVKELMENSLDADASEIIVNIKDSGKTLIQIIDNGKGMSETDARMSFERHATSKISDADDLFALTTMGFRGEALASIASVAQVEMRTRKETDELGTKLIIHGSELISQEPDNCPVGCNLAVKNLFYNVPARRKFLKTDTTEFQHIITEFERIALASPGLTLSLFHNDNMVFKLFPGKLKTRIVSLFGKQFESNITPVSIETSVVKIFGYIGKPDIARKRHGEQYFYVNNRFMRNAYFHKAIMLAYNDLLNPDTLPVYFINFEIDPKHIDVNIHPTKTEINFEDANSVFQLLQTAVKESLGKFNILPSIDFNKNGIIDIPVLNKQTMVNIPQIEINQEYNPFEKESKKTFDFHRKIADNQQDDNLKNWDMLYTDFNNQKDDELLTLLPDTSGMISVNSEKFMQLGQKYILSAIKSGLMIIDQKRAHEQILYEKFFDIIDKNISESQKLLFPEQIEFSKEQSMILADSLEELESIGFIISWDEDTRFTISGIPASMEAKDLVPSILSLIEVRQSSPVDFKTNIIEQLSIAMAKKQSINHQRFLQNEEMREIVDKLFACQSPSYTFDGKIIISTIKFDEIEKRF